MDIIPEVVIVSNKAQMLSKKLQSNYLTCIAPYVLSPPPTQKNLFKHQIIICDFGQLIIFTCNVEICVYLMCICVGDLSVTDVRQWTDRTTIFIVNDGISAFVNFKLIV